VRTALNVDAGMELLKESLNGRHSPSRHASLNGHKAAKNVSRR